MVKIKIQAEINNENKKVLLVTDNNENDIEELEISAAYYEHSLKEFTGIKGDMGIVSDGSHTFNELYYHRMILFSIICNIYKEKAWKSWRHDDDTMYNDYFIVGITTPEGDYSYHYHKDYWNMFNVKELDKAPKFDGHKAKDIVSLLSLL